MAKTPIVIFTMHTGGGHLNLAQSLKEQLVHNYDVTIVDPYPNILNHYYALLSRSFTNFWNLQYTFFNTPSTALFFHHVMLILIRRRIEQLVKQLNPQLILSTHALLSYELSYTMERMHKKIPLVFQLTDLEETHLAWFTEKHAAAYLAPSREIAAQALQNGIDKERVHATGRPIRSQFLHVPTETREAVLTSLGLDPTRFTIFLQGGAKGSAGIERTVQRILTAPIPMQIMLAIGNNKQLATPFLHTQHLKILPFTPTIAPYMAASDVIVGKAGASFLTEAFMLEKPCIITTYLPGQEGPTLRFIERYNLGWLCLEEEKQQQLLTTIASQPSMIAEKLVSIRTYKTWNMQANQQILAIIERVLASY